MSTSTSVWNGRNERILGTSTDSNTSINTLPTSNVDQSDKTSDSGVKNSANNNSAKATAPAPAPVPTRTVWNGRHNVIKAIAAPQPAVVAAPSPVDVSPNGVCQATKSGIVTKKKNGANNSNNKNPENNKVVLPASLSKDVVSPVDEGTNSTAGSSTTNTTIDDDTDANHRSGRSDDGQQNVVVVQDVTTSPSSSSSFTTEEDNNKGPASKNCSGASNMDDKAANAPPVDTVGDKKKKERSSSSGSMHGGKNNQQKKGGKQNNINGHRNGNKKQQGSNGAKGSNNGQNGRRKANSPTVIHNADRPVCSFYIRGMCKRGNTCAFKHDPTMIAPFPSVKIDYQGNADSQISRHDSNNNQVPPPTFNRLGSGRTFDPVKARAIQVVKDAQDKEDRSAFASPFSHPELEKAPTTTVTEPPFFSIDVECIATGYGSCARGINDGCGNAGKNAEGVPSNQYNDFSHRYPGRVAMVDTAGNLLADIIIRPPQDGKGVVSYLTPLTGLTEELCLGPHATSLEEAVGMIKSLLPKDGVLVGQAINHDVEWLGLTPGKDFERMVDLSVIFRQRMPAALGAASAVLRSAAESGVPVGNKDAEPWSDEYVGFDTRYRSFSLRHVCLNLLGIDIQSGVHDPIIDATYSLTLFHKYRNSSVTQLRIVRDGLHRAPVTPGFAAEKTPVLDGVCVSAAAYPYKRAARKIWKWYSGRKGQQ